MEARTDDIGYQANRLSRLLRARMSHELAPLGLTPPQAAVLLALAATPAGLTPSAVADSLGMDRPTLTGVAERLARQGWLEIAKNPQDGRSRLLLPTRRCLEAAPALAKASAAAGARATQGFSAADKSRLVALMREAGDALEATARGGATR